MRVTIRKSTATGRVIAPPSKSMAHRMLICAGLSEGESEISGISDCEDVLATIDCLRALGVDVSVDGDRVRVKGKKMTDCVPVEPLRCRESGSTLRFFVPIAMLLGKTVMLSGAKNLMRRPMSVYEKIASDRGLAFLQDGESIVVKGPLPAGEYSLVGNVSSQFISGLLFALPLLEGDSKISITTPIESKSYINMTIYVQSLFGVQVEWADDRTLFIKGGQSYNGLACKVEGDYSNAAFLDALNVLGSSVVVDGLAEASTQGDSVYRKYFPLFHNGIPSIHLGDCPDLGPVLFALSAAKHGGVFSGTERLKIKESNRGQSMADELKKFGVSVKIDEDGIVVYPLNFHAPTEVLYGHEDHRIVMSLAVLLTVTGGTIEGAEAVRKSYPNFFADLQSLGVQVEYDYEAN